MRRGSEYFGKRLDGERRAELTNKAPLGTEGLASACAFDRRLDAIKCSACRDVKHRAVITARTVGEGQHVEPDGTKMRAMARGRQFFALRLLV
jgi:hypothetical protein